MKGRWTKSVTVKIHDEDNNELTAEVIVGMYHDAHYGEDADGNRGRPTDFIDNIIVLSLTDEKASVLEVTDELYKRIEKEIENLDPEKLKEE